MLTHNYPQHHNWITPFWAVGKRDPPKSPLSTQLQDIANIIYPPDLMVRSSCWRHHKSDSKNTEKYSWYSTGSLTSRRMICILPGEKSSIKPNYEPSSYTNKNSITQQNAPPGVPTSWAILPAQKIAYNFLFKAIFICLACLLYEL